MHEIEVHIIEAQIVKRFLERRLNATVIRGPAIFESASLVFTWQTWDGDLQLRGDKVLAAWYLNFLENLSYFCFISIWGSLLAFRRCRIDKIATYIKVHNPDGVVTGQSVRKA